MTLPYDQLLLLGGCGFVLAVGLGFLAGRLSAGNVFDRALRRASRDAARLVDLVLASLERAERAAASFEAVQETTLTAEQCERLDRGRGRLVATLANAVPARGPSAAETTAVPMPEKPKRRPKRFSITWKPEPVCERTEVSARPAFEENLTALFDASASSARSFGVMFVAIDKFDGLRLRFGIDAAEAFLSQTARMIRHGVRGTDLVCRYNADTFAVLLPEVDAASAGNVARVVRDTLRAHRFAADATSPEVHVTTSLGLALCHPGDNLPLLLGRLGEALSASRRKGRNQVHVHDGRSMSISVPA